MRTSNRLLVNSGQLSALCASVLLMFGASQALAVDCNEPLSRNNMVTALMAEGPAYYKNIPTQLRLDAPSSSTRSQLCDVYRAADGMDGALCITFTDAADTSPAVQTPLGSYGENAVDRLLRLPFDNTSETISCELANQLLTEVSALPFVPVETNASEGSVCLRDVMRGQGEPAVRNAVIRDQAGAEFSTGPLVNNGLNCFSLDETYAAGLFEVLNFQVDAFDESDVDLGQVANLIQPEMMSSQLSGVWFIKVGDPGTGVGSSQNPFNSIAAFHTAQGSTNGPQPGDFIYLIEGNSDELADPLELLERQWLVGRGEGLLDALAAYGVMPPPESDLRNSPYVEAGQRSSLHSFEQPPVVLSLDNTLYGLSLETAFAPALQADGLGSLTVRNTTVNANNGGIAVLSNMAIDLELSNVYAGGGFSVNAFDLRNTTGRAHINGGELLAAASEDQAELGRAVSLVNAENVTLEGLTIEGSNFGVYGRDVQNFSLVSSSVSRSFLSDDDPIAGIDFENVTGEVLLRGVEIDAGTDANIRVRNSAGILVARLEELELGHADTNTLSTVQFKSTGQAIMTVTLADSLLQGARNRAVECTIGDAAALTCGLVDNQILLVQDDASSNRYRQQPIMFSSAETSDADLGGFVMNYSVVGTTSSGHTINDSFRGAIAANFTKGQGVVNGVIANLKFGTEGNPLSGALFGKAIEVTTSASITHNLLVTDTKIFGAFNDGALRILGAGPTSTIIRNLQFFGDDADLLLQVSDTADETADSAMLHCLDIADSTLVSWDSPRYFALSQRNSAAGRIRLPGYEGSPDGEDSSANGNASADITAYLAGRNVSMISFNPEVQPVAYAPNVTGLLGGAEGCTANQ